MKGSVILVAAVLGFVWITFSPTSFQSRQTAAPPSSEIYKDVYNGWKWWHVYCYRCHGQNAVGGNLAPNLSDPNENLSLKDFLFTVRNGSADGQMQAWNKLLDEKQITQLYYYVKARREKVLPPGRPDEVGPKGGPWVPPKGWVLTK
jgi:mono/diheme cytochrome c family protein